MVKPIPNTLPASYTHASSTRLASRIVTDLAVAQAVGCRVGLIGVPDDLGVRLNNGRVGAAAGPRAVREALSRYGVAEPSGFDWPLVFDAGDVRPAEGDDERALHETHRRVSEAAAAIVEAGMIPVGLGGGHDLTFAFVRGCIEGRRESAPVTGLYADAHLDVRETVGSGMPFRRLIEDCGVRNLRAVGLNPFANAREHVEWFLSRGGAILDPLPHRGGGGRVREAGGGAGDPAPEALIPSASCFVSIDLDSVDGAHAPGVSAVNPAGLTPHFVADLCRAAGASPHVRCFDIMELNPAFDVDHRTARLAVHLLLAFLRGVSERPG